RTGDLKPVERRPPSGAERMTSAQILERVETAITALDGPQSVAWAAAYLASGADPGALVRRLALVASRIGNDPHNQEIAHCFLENYGKNGAPGSERLLLACAQHTARHRKYDDFLGADRRLAAAMI